MCDLTPDKLAELRRLYDAAIDAGISVVSPDKAAVYAYRKLHNALPALLDRLEALEKVRRSASRVRHDHGPHCYMVDGAMRCCCGLANLRAALEEMK